MSLDNRGVNSTIGTMISVSSGILSVIPILEELRLEKKLNEEKNKTELNAYSPEILARHIRKNGARLIGCNQQEMNLLRERLMQNHIPFVVIASTNITDEKIRPNAFFTLVIRDIDADRTNDIINDVMKELSPEPELEEEEEFEERLLFEPELAEETNNDIQTPEEQEIPEDPSSAEDDSSEERPKKKKTKKPAAKKSPTRPHTEQKKENRQPEHQNKKDYANAHVIRSEELRRVKELIAEHEYKTRCLALKKILDTPDYYEELKKQKIKDSEIRMMDEAATRHHCNELSDAIKAHDDKFSSVGQSSWRNFSEAVKISSQEATAEDLRNGTWDAPDPEDYLYKTPNGNYRSYTKEERELHLDEKYQGGRDNIKLNSYAHANATISKYEQVIELKAMQESCQTEEARHAFKIQLNDFRITEKELSSISNESCLSILEQSRKESEAIEHELLSSGYIGCENYRQSVVESAKHTSLEIVQSGSIAFTQNPSQFIKTSDGIPVADFRSPVFTFKEHERLYDTSFLTNGAAATAPKASKHVIQMTQVKDGEQVFKWLGNGSILANYSTATGFGANKINATCGGILMTEGVHIIESGSFKGPAELRQYNIPSNLHVPDVQNVNPLNVTRQSELRQSAFNFVPQSKETVEFSKYIKGQFRDAHTQVPNLGKETDETGRLSDYIETEKNTAIKFANPDIPKADIKASVIRKELTNELRDIRIRTDLNRFLYNKNWTRSIKQISRVAISSTIDETEAGRTARSMIDTVRVPAHFMQESIIRNGITAIKHSSDATNALTNTIIAGRVDRILHASGTELENYAQQLSMTTSELNELSKDQEALKNIIHCRMAESIYNPNAEDMQSLISRLGIRSEVERDGIIDSTDVLNFLSMHDMTTIAERERAFNIVKNDLKDLTADQEEILSLLFTKNILSVEESRARLANHGLDPNIIANWTNTRSIEDILMQIDLSPENAELLMVALNQVESEDRTAMIGLFSHFTGGDGTNFNENFQLLIEASNSSWEFKEAMSELKLDQIAIKDLKHLTDLFKNDKEAMIILEQLTNHTIARRAGTRSLDRMDFWHSVQRAVFRLAEGSDAMTGLNQVMNLGRAAYQIASSGYRLLYTLVMHTPVKDMAVAKLLPKEISAKAAVSTIKRTKIAAEFSQNLAKRKITRQAGRITNRILHPGQFIIKAVGNKATFILAKAGINVEALKGTAAVMSKTVASAAAAASEALAILALIILIIIALLMLYESIELDRSNNNYSAAYVSSATGEDAFAQEIVDMLHGYTDNFINEINNAQYNRQAFSAITGDSGFNTNEGVSAYESGAYQVVFRGPDGEPIEDIQNVDLNNSKDIISMASVFIPTVFQKPGEGASAAAIAEYEKDKEHFMDYCSFLWAASHQISVEEYHPGNSTNEDANDTSGMITDAQTGKCEMDYDKFGDKGAGINWWVSSGYSTTKTDKCSVCSGNNWQDTSIEEPACVEKPAANPCSHGHWVIKADTAFTHKACTRLHMTGSYDDPDYLTCSELGRTEWDKTEKTYRRVWVCDGHMGALVYVTIGKISRMPNFGEATDYDLDNPETFGGTGTVYDYFGGGVGGSAFQGTGYSVTDAQLRYIAGMCIAEQSACANTEVSMRYQASLMCNVYELYKDGRLHQGKTLYEYLTTPPGKNTGGWFATTTLKRAETYQNTVSDEALSWVRDVICNGNRITRANEQGGLGAEANGAGFHTVEYNGKIYTGDAIYNESLYVPGVTILYTGKEGAYTKCLFEAFPGGYMKNSGKRPEVDPFATIIN